MTTFYAKDVYYIDKATHLKLVDPKRLSLNWIRIRKIVDPLQVPGRMYSYVLRGNRKVVKDCKSFFLLKWWLLLSGTGEGTELPC